MSETSTRPAHPLDRLTADEVQAAVALVRAHPRFDEQAKFAYVGLAEPAKAAVSAWDAGDKVDRSLRMVMTTGPEANVVEVVVSVTDGAVVSVTDVKGMRPGLLFEESLGSILALQDDPDWQAAMAKRGLTDPEKIQIDPWPAGSFGSPHEDDRRICRCLAYVRDTPDGNGYARPVEGVVAFVDMARGEVLEVLDTGVVPLPPELGSYYPEDQPALREGLKPLDIVQPEGPSFTIDGNLLSWQRWSMRVGFDAIEGLVLHQVEYDDNGRARPVLFRASVSEMVVPYGDPGPLHGWKNAFDAGEWGLGRMANSLTLGCDCLGEIRYLDGLLTNEQGQPYPVPNAICIHEEDYGILWKHNDLRSGRNEVRRSRRLVASSIATVGNYEYGFYWYFYLDGTIGFEVKLTGIMSTRALAPGEEPRFASVIAPQLAAPYHQHLFNMRLDMQVDGPANSVYEMEALPVPPGPDNPWSNAFESHATLLRTDTEARRMVDPGRSRCWKVVSSTGRNRLGLPTAYKLLPGSTPTLIANPDSSVARRAGFATRNLWVTPFAPDERRGAGEYPNQHAGGDGLPAWTEQDRSIVDEDIVVWYTFGVTHIPRPEDWPVMPVEYAGFQLIPVGFFDANPALDVPPPPHCHT
ncbi:MAG TPA: primary-amine oxidase [Acidimicrobiales bacterium]|nr:primary-amine oxidase [Acidimicrobiales bacterium]